MYLCYSIAQILLDDRAQIWHTGYLLYSGSNIHNLAKAYILTTVTYSCQHLLSANQNEIRLEN